MLVYGLSEPQKDARRRLEAPSDYHPVNYNNAEETRRTDENLATFNKQKNLRRIHGFGGW